MTLDTLGKGPIPAPHTDAHPSGHDANLRVQQLLADIADSLHTLVMRAKRDDSTVIIDLSPTAIAYKTWQELRIRTLILSSAAGETLQVVIGTASRIDIINVTGGAQSIPFPILVGRGVDLAVNNLTTPASTSWRAYLIAGTE